MDTAHTPAVERIARVLAGQRLSSNAKGDDAHAADAVDRDWARYRDDAVAVLKTLRDPDQAMAAAGDVATWQRMIFAALGEHDPAPAGDEPPASGTDPLHEGP
jgi:hypothetical protein